MPCLVNRIAIKTGLIVDIPSLICYTSSMEIKTHRTQIRSIKPSDPNFIVGDGIVTAHRASIEISQRCPENYKDLIVECIRHGWIKPVAYMTEREMALMGLLNDS